MDESYEQLLMKETNRKKKSLPLNAGRIGVRMVHKVLVCVIAAIFRARALIDLIMTGLRILVLAPFDLMLCLAFGLWTHNHSAATSTHLDLGAVRGAFWNGDTIIVSTAMRTFFIKRKSADVLTPESRCTVPSAEDPKELSISVAALKSQNQTRRKPRNLRKWRHRKRNVSRTVGALCPSTPLTAQNVEQTIKRRNVLRERKARIRKALKMKE